MALVGVPGGVAPTTTYSEKHIETNVLGSAAASITFSTGLTSYKFFRLSYFIKGDPTFFASIGVKLNGATSYDYQRTEAHTTTVQTARNTGSSTFPFLAFDALQNSGLLQGAIFIAKPAASRKAQAVELTGFNGRSNGNPSLFWLSGEWNNTADLISSIEVADSSGGSMAVGTSISLFGVEI